MGPEVSLSFLQKPVIRTYDEQAESSLIPCSSNIHFNIILLPTPSSLPSGLSYYNCINKTLYGFLSSFMHTKRPAHITNSMEQKNAPDKCLPI